MPGHRQEEHWIPLARNKFGDCVAGLLVRDNPQTCLIMLPQMPEIHSILEDLVGNWCVQLRPKLFPFHQGSSWLHTPRYELPQVTHLYHDIERTKEEAETQVAKLQEQIKEIRAENDDWYTLLNGTGDELVGAVIRSLAKLGFKEVVDVDAQARAEGNDRNLREDIQIRDRSPVLVVDVKGITGCPEDAEATQSEKHALMRSKEFQGDVKPLTIINPERNLPPHDRNPNPYREEIIGNAIQTGLGLMTTWDVFRLLRNKEGLGWTNDVVTQVFYRTGRIEPVPAHYIEIGNIVHVWKNAFGVVPNQPIEVGNRLAVETGDLYEELIAESLQVDDTAVDEAPAESNCGVACESASSRFKNGMRVFLIR